MYFRCLSFKIQSVQVHFESDNVHNSIHSMTIFFKWIFPGGNCIELNQPALMVVKPGESFSIGCKITGYSASGGCTNWIRQLTGKAMEWIGWFCSSGNTGTSNTMKNKISFTAETSSNTVFLRGQNFQTEDSAVYYCAQNTQCHELPGDLCNNSHIFSIPDCLEIHKLNIIQVS